MFTKKAHIHFLGIGGIGMSGIATVLKHQGYTISGCDADLDQQSVRKLCQIGCQIYQGNNTPACRNSDVDIVVYSSAVGQDHPELAAARKRGIPTIPRAVMLAELMRTKYSVAIGGSHGKTTTTSLISHILIEAGMDPTVIIGGHLKTISNNARLGGGDFLVAEADESDRSLLHLHATIALITNVDLEHLETYRDLADVKETFRQFISHLPFYGLAIVCDDDPEARSLLPIPHVRAITYGTTPRAHLYATEIQLSPDYSTFNVHHNGSALGHVTLSMPGHHNVLNALGAIALARTLNVPFNRIASALQRFKGIDRRFSYNGTYHGAEIFDDYGHHPKEIALTLAMARRRAKGRVIVFFQPHRYSRTHHLWKSFVKVLSSDDLDHLVMTDIYAASEAPLPGVTTQRLAADIATAQPTLPVDYVPFDKQLDALHTTIKKIIRPDDLVLLLGAGKVNLLAQRLLNKQQMTPHSARSTKRSPTLASSARHS